MLSIRFTLHGEKKTWNYLQFRLCIRQFTSAIFDPSCGWPVNSVNFHIRIQTRRLLDGNLNTRMLPTTSVTVKDSTMRLFNPIFGQFKYVQLTSGEGVYKLTRTHVYSLVLFFACFSINLLLLFTFRMRII